MEQFWRRLDLNQFFSDCGGGGGGGGDNDHDDDDDG